MILDTLPADLEDVEQLLRRRLAASTRRELWRSIYQDAYTFAMPSRETFTWRVEGQQKERTLYDSTLQEATYTAGNTMIALLFPSWSRWMELAAGFGIAPSEVPPEVRTGLQKATGMFFDYLNHSNFATVISEVALDLLIGTGGLCFDEGEGDDDLFRFYSIPLSAIEIEEGPDGRVQNTFQQKKMALYNIPLTYPSFNKDTMPDNWKSLYTAKPESEVTFLQMELYSRDDKQYYGVVVDESSKKILWRYKYGKTCPTIVARAMKVAGETYGRGRVLLALSDARTLDKMQEFVLRHSAMQIAPPMTGVSDGVLNPYTAVLAPNTILPVASNDNGNPSLKVLETGGDFKLSETIMGSLRERIRRTLIGPEPSEGAVKSATEIQVSDRNRLWAMNGEMNRIQAELLAPIVARGVEILQRRGKIPKFKINGHQVSVTWNSPFAKSQNSTDVMALQTTLANIGPLGPAVVAQGLKVEDVPAWVARKAGVDELLIRTDAERAQIQKSAAQAAQAQQQQQGGAPGGAAPQGALPAPFGGPPQ